MTEIDASLESLGLSPAFSQALHKFVFLFQKWNRSINLSAARSETGLAEHVIDSLHIIPHLRASAARASAAMRILDVGAGGGLPAVIIAICLPGAQVTALEPVHKKHAFLRTAARELALPNFDPQAHRIDDHQERDYDATTSRATFDLHDWLTLGLRFVRPGGLVLGFEAIPRTDLPAATGRFPYSLGDKSRAIVTLQRSVTSSDS